MAKGWARLLCFTLCAVVSTLASGIALPQVDEEGALERLRGILQFPTMADVTVETDHIPCRHKGHPEGVPEDNDCPTTSAFTNQLAYLESAFPTVFSRLQVEHVGAGGWSRLLTWAGTDPSLASAPVLFLSHLDVVHLDRKSVV